MKLPEVLELGELVELAEIEELVESLGHETSSGVLTLKVSVFFLVFFSYF